MNIKNNKCKNNLVDKNHKIDQLDIDRIYEVTEK